MELKMQYRQLKKKSETKRARREGLIPAVIYKQGKVGDEVFVENAGFSAFLRGLKPGHLPTTQLELMTEDGKKRRAIIKDIQYHRTTYQVLHLDFLELEKDALISVKVPIEFVGAAECLGVKQGGILRQVIRYLRVRCAPKHLPHSFTIDVKDIAIGQVRRLKDIAMSDDIRPLDKLNEVAVVIAKR